MRILITGATGFLGTALSRRLAADGHELAKAGSANCDLTKPASLERFAQGKFDQIYHLAAWTQAGDFCLHHPGQQWLINQMINTQVLQWWQSLQPQAKLISMGTSCSYDPSKRLTEANYLVGEPIESLYTYAMTKRMLHVGQTALHRQYGLNYLCLVPSTLYGPGYHTDGRQMHFIFDLIRKILDGRDHGKPVILWGDGYQRRELVFVDDFVGAMIQLAEATDNEIVNIGAGEEHTIRQFAALICAQVGYDPGAIQYDTARYVGAKSKCLEVEKLKQLLPDLALTPISEGLRRTIAWLEAARHG